MKSLPRIFSTCPQSSAVDRESYLQNVVDVARWSEISGCEGILVYTDNSLVDPWLVSQIIIESTERLCPLVAVQPIYMHPYAVAKMVSSIGHLYGRRVWLNMVAGGFKNDLAALNDLTPHDKRYDRLMEYVTIVSRLLESTAPVSYDGEFYQIDKLKLAPPLSPSLRPGIMISGSSDAGFAAAKAIGATPVMYPRPVGEYDTHSVGVGLDSGIRVGIITRKNSTEAWRVAYERFPEDRKGQLTHHLAMKISDSVWHRQLAQGVHPEASDSPYWLRPFQNYKTFCPYLVGSYDRVAEELVRYMMTGFSSFILDIPANEEELVHIGTVFKLASAEAVV